ncbi:MAG TPA: Xaa-Pro peptidase family protein [Solirubrobacter sp.]|nr:Xaa-Pro peptidase family protein [Solirubrobacter sp.]
MSVISPDPITAKLRGVMHDQALDAVVPMSPENLAYASGAAPPSQRTVRSRLAAAIIPVQGDTEVVTIALEAPLVREQTRLDRVTAYQEFVQDPVRVVADSLVERGLAGGRIGLEATYLSRAGWATLAEALPGAELVAVDEALAQARVLKTPGEIDAIRRIGQAAERIHRECVAEVGAGSTERELANLITERYFEAGGDALTMLVVGSGPRSAHPNAPATGRALEPGDVVRMDIIGTADHYYSDVARTAVVGPPTGEQRKLYDLLRSVHERCLAALRPGALTSDVYRVYVDAMDAAGFPPYHFVGHGLGVTLHEDPFVNSLRSVRLEEGMVLCIEPLTFLEGRFGMQIEDEVLITADGCEPFTHAEDLLRIG